MKITVGTNVAAPIETVREAYTTPEDIKQWNAASDDWHTTYASVDLREGGTFSSRMEAKDTSTGFDFAGTYTKIIEHKLIEYSFGDRLAQVVFTTRPTGVDVQVTFDSDLTHSLEQQRGGWQAILNNFARHVESKRRIRGQPASCAQLSCKSRKRQREPPGLVKFRALPHSGSLYRLGRLQWASAVTQAR